MQAVVREQAAPGYLKRLHLYYHFIAWGLPLIGVVILFATEVRINFHIARIILTIVPELWLFGVISKLLFY